MMQRRKFIRKSALTLGAAALGALAYRFSREESGNYDTYFAELNSSLKKYKRAVPSLLIDLDYLDKNLTELKRIIKQPNQFRIVVKSLPSLELISYLQKEIGTNRLMCFHQPFLSQISAVGDASLDILMGKPMPVQTAAYYYETLQPSNGFNPTKQLQWLVDTPARIAEYIELAKSKNLQLRLNVEIDVGLHRGGFDNLSDLENALKLIEQHPSLVQFSGFMGYDAHIVKVPSLLLSREAAYAHMRDFYNACKNLVKEKFPTLWHENLTFNGAGSPTLTLHNQNDSPINDISAGSFAVKPTDFDIDTLSNFQPASFIATPVLKKYKGTTLPSVEKFSKIFGYIDPNQQLSYYIYGGSWMADPVQPKGIRYNNLFGKSTNQVMLNSSEKTNLNVGDFVFFRPHQSEFVFLQFGQILCIRKAQIIEEWSIFQSS